MTLNLPFYPFSIDVVYRFLVGNFIFENVIRRNDDFMSHGNESLFTASTGQDADVFATQVTIFLSGCCPRTLHKKRSKVSVTHNEGSAFFLPALSLFPGLKPAQLLK